MPLRQCTFNGCTVAVEVPHGYRQSPRCETHQRPVTHSKREYSHHHVNGKNIYKSYRWTKLRKQYVLHQPLCEHCLRYDIVKPGKILDHIKEIEDGGEIWNVDNLALLCHACHNTKTGKEAVKRARKKGNNGFGSLSDF